MTRSWRRWGRVFGGLAAVALLLFLTRCGQQSSYTPGTFTAVYNQTLKRQCIQCHVPGGVENVNLDFTTADTAYSTMINQPVTGPLGTSGASPCTSKKIVVPGNANNSYLTGVLFDDYKTKIGCSPYPTHYQDQQPYISADEKKSMVDWINGGAKKN